MADKKPIIVPWDFTHTTRNAFLHVLRLTDNTPIILLNIVKKDTLIFEQEVKLTEAANVISKEHNIQPITIVRDGTIFKTINQVVADTNSVLVVMGTHGMKGLQKLTGSWALKVIVGSKIPYLVVQNPPNNVDMLKIVYSVDYKTANKEKLIWVEFLAKIFKVKTFLFTSTSKDGVVDSRTKANLVFNKKFLEDKGIDYELSMADGKASFQQETVSFAEKINADIILVMTTRDIAFHDYVLGVYEQYVIANSSHVPVLVINPRTDLMRYGYGSFG